MWLGLGQLDDATALIARILLTELGRNTLDFPLLQTKVVSSTMLLEYAPVRDASVFSLRPELYLREKIEALRQIRLDGPATATDADSTTEAPSLFAGETTLLDIIEVREWLHRRNSHTTLAWMVRPGQWTYWGLTKRERATLGQAFAASLSFGNRAAAELTLALGQLIGLAILAENPSTQITIRLQSLLVAADKISATAKSVDTTVQTICRQCFEALGALESAGLISDVVLPSPALQQRATTPAHWRNLTVTLGGSNGTA